MLPKVASILTYAGPLADYSATIDSTTDRPASGTNPAYGDVAAMTHTALRAWARFQPNGITAPSVPTGQVLANVHDEVWNNGNNAAPLYARSSTGQYTVTYPATVVDEIPINYAGYTGPVAVNLRGAWANVEPGAATDYDARAVVTSANVVTVKVYQKGSSTLVDLNDGTVLGVFAV
jgi:hypothetical protein